jgi:IS5 family transposase
LKGFVHDDHEAKQRGRPPIGLKRMLRGRPPMYCVQQWFGLSDEGVEDAVTDSRAVHGLCGDRSGAGKGAGCDDAAAVPAPAGKA